MNPFDVLSTTQLVQFVQNEQLELKAKKSWSPKRKMQRMSRIGEAREVLVARLKTMDRNKPDFFPIGSHIELNDYRNPGVFKGTVKRHSEDQVEVELDIDGNSRFIWVWPRFLKLLYIKQRY
jgi:hypothetical protein